MTKKPGLIFDFDGVLADSFDILYRMVSESFADLSFKLSAQEYRDFYKGNVKKSELDVLGENNFRKFQRLLERRRHFYDRVRLFDSAKRAIPELARLADLVVVSSTPAQVIEKKLTQENLTKFFSLILGAESEFTKKTKLQYAIKSFEIAEDRVFLVSDTTGDLLDGKEVGLNTAAVTWGFHDRELLATVNPTLIIDSFDELFAYLKT